MLVSMMDNTMPGESMDSLVWYTVIFSCFSRVVLFLLFLGLSKWIIQTLEVSYQKQFISGQDMS